MEDVFDEARDDRLEDGAEAVEGWSLGANLLRAFLPCDGSDESPEKAGELESCLWDLGVLWREVLSVSTNLNSR